MACKVCKSRELESVHKNGFVEHQGSPEGLLTRFIVHAGVGVQIMKCTVCNFMSPEFVHPHVVNIIYENPPLALVLADDPQQKELQRQSCMRQFDFLNTCLPRTRNRILFLGAGRSENAKQYASSFDDVYACDLAPLHNKVSSTEPELDVVSFSQLGNHALINTFDLIIVSNVLERIAFPLKLIRLCARLLKQKGRLFMEVPNMSECDIYNSLYGREEINFFSKQSLESFFMTDGNFKTIKLEEANEPVALKNATPFGLQSQEKITSKCRSVIRLVLENQRSMIEDHPTDIEQQDIPQHLCNLSMTSLVSSIGLSRFSVAQVETDAEQTDQKSKKLELMSH